MASVQLEFFRAQKVSRAVDLQISTPRCASHGCNSLERALANQLAACKKMQKDAKRYEKQMLSKGRNGENVRVVGSETPTLLEVSWHVSTEK